MLSFNTAEKRLSFFLSVVLGTLLFLDKQEVLGVISPPFVHSNERRAADG